MYIDGGEGAYLLSTEGSTQGDNSSMSMYAVSTKPLIEHLKSDDVYRSRNAPKPKQIFYADDSGAGGQLVAILAWWKELLDKGPLLGYHPQSTKCHLIVKDEAAFQRASEIFQDTGVNITLEGRPYLGSAIGTTSYVRQLVREKVQEWVKNIKSLSEVATSEPHAAFYGYINGISKRWLFLMRTTPEISDLLQPIEDALKVHLLPSLVGRQITDQERKIFSLPAKYGGLGIANPVEIADAEFQASRKVTMSLANTINNQLSSFEEVDWEETKKEKSSASNRKKNVL